MRCKNLYYSIVIEFTDNGGSVASYLNTCLLNLGCMEDENVNIESGAGKIVNETAIIGVNNSFNLFSLYSCFRCHNKKTPTFVGNMVFATGFDLF